MRMLKSPHAVLTESVGTEQTARKARWCKEWSWKEASSPTQSLVSRVYLWVYYKNQLL